VFEDYRIEMPFKRAVEECANTGYKLEDVSDHKRSNRIMLKLSWRGEERRERRRSPSPDKYRRRRSVTPEARRRSITPEARRNRSPSPQQQQPIEDVSDASSDERGCRDMTKCFKDGQRIRHCVRQTASTWIGKYDSEKNMIVCEDGTYYTSLTGMAKAHNLAELPHRSTNTANGWRECQTEIGDGKWISTYSLQI
jgi:hypothetical protein